MYALNDVPGKGQGMGLWEAPRGRLAPLQRDRGEEAEELPVAWCPPRGTPRRGTTRGPGPIEEALVGTPVLDPDKPLEVFARGPLLRPVHRLRRAHHPPGHQRSEGVPGSSDVGGEMAEERYYKHDGFERFTHWTHTLDTVILVLSGMQIHYPGFSVFGAMQNARFLHHWSRRTSSWPSAFTTRTSFSPRQAPDRHAGALRLLGGGGDPEVLSPYQAARSRRTRSTTFCRSTATSCSSRRVRPPDPPGVRLYPYFLPGVFSFVFAVFGDAVQIRIWHTTIMWLFISFTALHVYLVVDGGPRRMVQAMIDGYYYRKTPGGATEG